MTYLVNQRAKSTGLPVEKAKGVVSPSFVSLQGCGARGRGKGLSRESPITNARAKRGQQYKLGLEQRGEKVS